MISHILIVNAILLLAYMSVWFALAYARKRVDTVDIAWGLGFVVVAWSVVAQQASSRSWLIAVLVSIWGARLAFHIGRRSLRRDTEDPRYQELGENWRGNFWLAAYTRIFILQGALVWIISLPIVMVTGPQLSGLGWLSPLGVIAWLVGFGLEAVADRQLASFLRSKDRPKVLQTGLWHYSRHPNHFGELLQWWAIGIIALQAHRGWIGLAGPLVLTFLIIFVSGIPPIEKRRQKDPEYRTYQRQTSSLIPWPPASRQRS